MGEPELRTLLLEQRAVLLEQRDALETATVALVDLSAELRRAREENGERDARLDGLLAAQERFLDMVEAHQERLDAHERRLDAHEERHDGAEEARAELTERVDQVEAAQLSGWRLSLAVVGLVLTGAGVMLTGVLVGSDWTRW